MKFYQQLQTQTQAQRDYLLTAPVISEVWEHRVDLNLYTTFLCNAYHHVKHTAPLMLYSLQRLKPHQQWVRNALEEYIEEEQGHEEWILNDLAQCGLDKEAIRYSQADFEIEMMVAFLYDYINRHNAMGIFGMVQVLEGTSVALATEVARIGKEVLKLPDSAFTYLTSHGALDVDHLAFYEKLMNQVSDHNDKTAIIHCANRVYKLYGNMYRALPLVRENKHVA